jgi:hypothetical protein
MAEKRPSHGEKGGSYTPEAFSSSNNFTDVPLFIDGKTDVTTYYFAATCKPYLQHPLGLSFQKSHVAGLVNFSTRARGSTSLSVPDAYFTSKIHRRQPVASF